MKSMRRRLIMSAAVLASAVGLAGTSLAQSKEPLRFGLAMPLTGSQALFGADQAKAAQWAVQDINAKGGVEGRPLEMILLDTQADPRLGINAVNRLINVEKVPVYGTAWSSVVKAVAPVSNRSKVLELSVGANSPEIAKLGDYVYTTYPLADVDIRAQAKYARETLKKERAAVLYIHNDSGVEGAEIYRDTFKELGGKVVAYEAYDAQSTDFTGALLKVRSANADIVHIQGLVSDLPQVIAQMRQLGLKQQVSTYSAGYNPKVLEQLGAAAEGMIVSALAPSAEQNEQVAKFVERWKATEGRIPNGLPYTQYLYDLPYLVADLYRHLLKTGQPLTGENMRKALVEIRKFDLPTTGLLEVGADHRVQKPVYLYEVKNGAFTPIATVK
ncbi:ABC transporter substrate-binding protein [Parapusillimonas granuli]|uniref:ABC transporter substrate-binding protein n=1 Tax=Parapusillimonas granuli TaxID=380911 RepID=A0A853FYN4_9BURK|nr:ABC transporter substrate-binding protein [Parapusillimonas granuli]MBB5215761.1 branched-chain amino acid transport system substrate-binding protein [Parapusillimonas granuli]MEB2399548.1 ABC transporter substrate-binding protein [Alcaligenaceae bacterium]NYT51175.1 ABC transporter substrate-binding protein [Parapusillimonas granuli]